MSEEYTHRLFRNQAGGDLTVNQKQIIHHIRMEGTFVEHERFGQCFLVTEEEYQKKKSGVKPESEMKANRLKAKDVEKFTPVGMEKEYEAALKHKDAKTLEKELAGRSKLEGRKALDDARETLDMARIVTWGFASIATFATFFTLARLIVDKGTALFQARGEAINREMEKIDNKQIEK